MSTPVTIQPVAQNDISEAYLWYEHKQVGLGDRFIEEVERVLSRIAESPTLYACVRGDVRRATTHTFPYVIYYSVLADSVEVIAVLHGSRKPSVWKRRI